MATFIVHFSYKDCSHILYKMESAVKDYNEGQPIKDLQPVEVYLYVLRLRSPPGEPPRFYVGSAKNYKERLDAHFRGAGAAFTKKYKPIELVELRQGDRFDEESMTRRLMAEYGIDYVRGGAYTRLQLTPEDTATLQHEIWAAAGLCMNCGRPGHFAENCMASPKHISKIISPKNISPKNISPNSISPRSEIDSEEIVADMAELKIKCERCGRRNHSADDCHTKLENINCQKCFKRGHRTDMCWRATDDPEESWKTNFKCYRCGYFGHTPKTCTNKYDIDGEPITAYNKYKDQTVDNESKKKQSDLSQAICFKCNSYGHIMRNCPK